MYKAICDIRPTKVLGPDGFHAVFYQNYWGIVGQHNTEASLGVLNGN